MRRMNLERALPETEGIPCLLLKNMMERWDRQLCHVHGYMILRHGKVVAEAYRHPYSSQNRRLVHSVSKTLTAAAIGFAVQEGRLSLEDRVVSFFPNGTEGKNSGEYLGSMTIRHLLTMTAGHDRDSIGQMFAYGREMWRAFLDMPVVYPPGTRFTYDSGATYLLSKILTVVTGELLQEYLEKRLFAPLGMKGVKWDEQDGVNTGGWGACLTLEEMARLGQFFLQKGMWNGKQLLSEEWMTQACAKHIETAEANVCRDWKAGYGYQMWRCQRENTCRADGAFGQFVLILPEKDMTAVIWSEDAYSQEMLDSFWEEVYDRTADEVFAVDGAAFAEYQKLCRSWAAPRTFAPSASYLELSVSGNAYYGENASEKDISGMRFTFSETGQLCFEVEKAGDRAVLRANNQELYVGKSHIPFEIASFIRLGKLAEGEKNYAAVYQWLSDHALKIHMVWLDTAHATDITCVFAKNQVFAVFTPSYGKFLADSPLSQALVLQETVFCGYSKTQRGEGHGTDQAGI